MDQYTLEVYDRVKHLDFGVNATDTLNTNLTLVRLTSKEFSFLKKLSVGDSFRHFNMEKKNYFDQVIYDNPFSFAIEILKHGVDTVNPPIMPVLNSRGILYVLKTTNVCRNLKTKDFKFNDHNFTNLVMDGNITLAEEIYLKYSKSVLANFEEILEGNYFYRDFEIVSIL